jgi:acetyl-CoA/propionyl-CoA carboxylase biotin carboxyl carrier protein
MTREVGPREAAARLGATTRSVQRWIATGRLPARRVGGQWRVAIDALDAFGRAGEPSGAAVRRLFIANRGEIAARISRTAKALGIAPIVPDADRPGGLDLLSIDAVVAAARASESDALHPGFGFLAENADFAEAVEAAGLRWLGPPPEAIRTMGDKAAARRLAADLGVPVVPGYDEPDQSDAALAAAAREIGVPLLVKPTGGGGGKGMRVVRDLARLDDALAAARREAVAAFGDGRLILERLIEGARHVEVQVLFDERGGGVHLGERDCSIQRRNQKILEETPSPAVDGPSRTRLTGAALALARAVGYRSAGTCEFLLDDQGAFYFLEMNTRLQVEHPVTEMVTGRDLVADQLRIAAGEPLGFGQADVRPAGHAVEVRLYAEDAEAGFLPATGTIEALRWPDGPGVRVDAGVEEGTEVGGRFDPLLAKIVAHGRDRAEAFDRLADALDRTVVLGLTTNLRFLRWLVRQPVVRDGEARIDTLDRIWPPDGWSQAASVPDDAWRAAGRALGGGGWRLNADPVVRLVAGDESRTVAIPAVDGQSFSGPVLVVAGDRVHADVGGRSIEFRLAPPPDVDAAARAAAAHGHAAGTAEVVAPMPGSVVEVHAAVGDVLDAGAPIVTLEAMKMEHAVSAPTAGRLAELLVGRGDQVARGQLLAVLEA